MLTVLKRQVIERLGINRIARSTDRQVAELDALRSQVMVLRSEVDALRSDADTTAGVSTQQPIDIWRRVALGSILSSTLLGSNLTVSVVMATRDRGDLLRRALQSVLGQTHRGWQLVVVDDGSTDHTSDVLDEIVDERVIRFRSEGVGAAAARNLGLDHATGDWVAFLDDDNVMDPGWLHAVAVYAAREPDAQVVFGAQLRSHEDDQAASFADAFVLFNENVDRAGLNVSNTIDLGALAVRRDTSELHFDATLTRFIDWDLVCRLEAVHTLHPLPVWAGIYTTDAPQRITLDGGSDAVEAFRRRLSDRNDRVGEPRSERASD